MDVLLFFTCVKITHSDFNSKDTVPVMNCCFSILDPNLNAEIAETSSIYFYSLKQSSKTPFSQHCRQMLIEILLNHFLVSCQVRVDLITFL